jgi:hypothetical protein
MFRQATRLSLVQDLWQSYNSDVPTAYEVNVNTARSTQHSAMTLIVRNPGSDPVHSGLSCRLLPTQLTSDPTALLDQEPSVGNSRYCTGRASIEFDGQSAFLQACKSESRAKQHPSEPSLYMAWGFVPGQAC